LPKGAALDVRGNLGCDCGPGVVGGPVVKGIVGGGTLFREGPREELLLLGARVRTFLALFLDEGIEEAPTTSALSGGGASTIPKASRSAAVPLRCRSISG